jgi:DNA repair photolyase
MPRIIPIRPYVPREQRGGPPLPEPEAIKGRGTAWTIDSRYARQASDAQDDGWGTLEQIAAEESLAPRTQIIEEHVRSVLSSNESPDIAFDLSVNPYRGCEHGCIYCFARPTHSYLDMSPGLDFETRIVAKVNAAQKLREALSARGYRPRIINIGAVTDAYQPVERRLRITRSVVEVMSECAHPFSLVTKSSGVERDLDLIAPMAARRLVAVYVSVTSLDPALARIMEPRAAAPHRRLQTIATLSAAGVPVGVSVSPVIPFINEPEIERILEAAAQAGARAAFGIVVRLPWEVNPLFQQWLDQHFPQRAARVMARIREMRGGRDYDARFGARMRGEGVWAQLIAQRFAKAVQRLNLNRERVELDTTLFRPPPREPKRSPLRPRDDAQGELF